MDQAQGFVSLKQVIAEVLRVFDSEDVTFSSMVEDAADALLFIGSFDYSEDKTATIEICDYSAKIPCDIITINQIKNDKGIHLTAATDSFHLVNQNTEDKYLKSQYTYTINVDHIFTGFEEGTIYMNYRALPLDAEGYPLIPAHISFRNAVKYNIMWGIAQRLWYKNKITENVYRDIEQNRNWYIAQAQAKVKVPSHDQMEALANQYVRLINDSNAHSDFFATVNLPQNFKRHP